MGMDLLQDFPLLGISGGSWLLPRDRGWSWAISWASAPSQPLEQPWSSQAISGAMALLGSSLPSWKGLLSTDTAAQGTWRWHLGTVVALGEQLGLMIPEGFPHLNDSMVYDFSAYGTWILFGI